MMPICVSYLTNNMPIIGGWASLIFANEPMPMLPKIEGCHSGNIYAVILIFAHANVAKYFKFCQFMPMLPKMEKAGCH